MMKFNQEEVTTLIAFCNADKINGWCANTWFNLLVRKYPFHFLYYTKDKKERFHYHKGVAKERIKISLGRDVEDILCDYCGLDVINDLGQQYIQSK